MKQDIRKSYLIISSILLLIGLISVTYGFFNYTKTGLANNFRVGRIYFNTSQNGNISLSNVFPITSEDLNNDVGNHDSVTITITGDSTYTDGVEYLVTFTDVNNVINGKAIPIMFNVESTGIGTSSSDYYNERSGNASIYKLSSDGIVLEDLYVLVGHIASGQTGINGSITITAYIGADNIAISDTYDESGTDNMGTTREWVDGRTVLTTNEWNNIQGNNAISFKVKVEANEGIWVEDKMPESCFSTYLGAEYYYYNENRTNSDINNCVTYFETLWGEEEEYDTVDEGETYHDFCAGTGTNWGQTMQQKIDNDYFSLEEKSNLEEINIFFKEYGAEIKDYNPYCGSDVVIPERIRIKSYVYSYNNNRTNSDINSCVSYLENSWGAEVEGNTVDIGETYYDFCAGSGTNWGQTFMYNVDNYVFNSSQISYFVGINIINMTEINNEYKYRVTSIYGDRDAGGAFQSRGLTSVQIPNTVKNINSYAFSGNNLTSVIIPGSVISIGRAAFSHNNLSNVIFSDGVGGIGASAFYDNNLTSVVIPDSVKTISENAFQNNNITSLSLGNGIKETNNGMGSGLNKDAFDFTKITYLNKETFDSRFFYNLHGSNKLSGDLVLGNDVKEIGYESFDNQNLTSITVPDSVKIIGSSAFNSNNLTSVIIGSGIETINSNAFYKSDYYNINLSSITINKSCSVIKNMSNYPWIGSINRTGTTIYGANNEVCDSW